MKRLKVVVADDSKVIRNLLRHTLFRVKGLDLLGMACDGVEAITMTRAFKPHVLILDVSMPRKNGIEVLREVRNNCDQSIVIIMFTGDPSEGIREACLSAGADYYLDKSQISQLVTICQQQLLESGKWER